jgi:hypothetical protein
MGEMRTAYDILVRKPEWKSPLGKPRLIWEDESSMGLSRVGWEVMDWMHLDQDRNQWRALVNTLMNFRVP